MNTAVEENYSIITYHFDSSSPHVSRIFSAHSLDTSPDPLKRGSSLSLINTTQKRITEMAMLARRMTWKFNNQI